MVMSVDCPLSFSSTAALSTVSRSSTSAIQRPARLKDRWSASV
jgi:hypothetical protein